MNNLFIALSLFISSISFTFAGPIFTTTGEVNTQDVYENVSLSLFGNQLLTRDCCWAGQYNGYFTLPEEANVIVLDSPAVNFIFRTFIRFDDENGDFINSFFTNTVSYQSNTSLAFFSTESFHSIWYSLRGQSGSDFANADANGILLSNIHWGHYSYIETAPPLIGSSNIPEPTSIGIYLLGLFGVIAAHYRK